MEKENILEKYSIPDKTEQTHTTSKKFKSDVLDFSSKNPSKERVLIEFGTAKGFSSLIFSTIYKEVHSVNIKQENSAIEIAKSRDNLYLYEFDLYASDATEQLAKLPNGDVYFIDAVHDYKSVISDTFLAKTTANPNAFIIYDDYGAFSEVKKAINFLVQNNVIKLVMYIGMEKGWSYGPPISGTDRILKDFEGVICQLV